MLGNEPRLILVAKSETTATATSIDPESTRHFWRARGRPACLTATASLSEAIALAAADLLAGIAAKAGHAGGVNCVFAESITRSRFPC